MPFAAFRTLENISLCLLGLVFLLFVAAFLAPVFTAIWAHHRYPELTRYCNAVLGTFWFIVVVPFYVMAAGTGWSVAGVRLCWVPRMSTDAWMMVVTLYLALFPIYLGLSMVLFGAVSTVRKHERR
jgi:hypothetical protein